LLLNELEIQLGEVFIFLVNAYAHPSRHILLNVVSIEHPLSFQVIELFLAPSICIRFIALRNLQALELMEHLLVIKVNVLQDRLSIVVYTLGFLVKLG
jgi:hypothetical protein